MKPDSFRGIFRTDEPARAVYSEGAGIAREIPSAVAVPADPADVEALVLWAAANRQPLIPRGSGSGMAGGAVGPDTIVDLSRMDRLGAIDSKQRTVWAEPGVLCRSVDAAARTTGLRFPVDPSSAAFCTVGGMASTNAAGPHSLKLGSMRRWVRSLDCVFSDGSRGMLQRGAAPPTCAPVQRFLELEPTLRGTWRQAEEHDRMLRKDSSGYALKSYFESGDLVDLIVGSEGTLAIIVAVELQLAPVPPATRTVLAAFGSLEAAARGAELARDSGAAACELLDKTFLDLVGGGSPAQPQSRLNELARQGRFAAVLIAEVEADDARGCDAAASSLRIAFELAGAEIIETARTPASEKELWDLRHAASPILSRLRDVTSMQFIEDGAVPPAGLPDYVRGVRAALDDRSVRGVIFGHAGDANVHVNPLIDLGRPDWRETVAGLLEDVVALTGSLGGTLAGEHGDGRLRTPLLPRVWSAAAITAFADVKRCFDPSGIFNPGVKVPLQGQRAINQIKHDPALSPLPPAARAALDDVAERRAYSDFRLSLVGRPS